MLRIIFVDDEPLTIKMLYKLLDWGSLDIEIAGEAHNGLEALALVESVNPDIILVDIKMPVMDGLAFMEELKKRKIRAEVIVLSAYGEFSYAQKAISCGARDYLLKPVDENRLLQIVFDIKNRIVEEGRKLLEYETSKRKAAEVINLESSRTLAEVINNRVPDRVKTYIKQNYSSQITLEEVSAVVSVSRNYLCKLFKQEEGKSIWEYLTEIRIEKAKELLRNTDMKGYEIASAIGYDSMYYFSKIFKKCMGVTPFEYRNRK